MRVAVDISAAVNQGAGIGRYARRLIPETAALLADDSFRLWYAPEPEVGPRHLEETRTAFGSTRNATFRQSRFHRRRMDQLWFRVRLPVPIELWTGKCDLVYSPDFTAPPAFRTPSFVTIHDLAFEIVPERAPAALRNYLSQVVPRQVERASAVVTVSETTKLDLQERMSVPAGKITVVSNAADERFFAAEPLADADRASIGVPKDYLLAVGTLEPRKNHLNLFRAIERLPRGYDVPLVVAGRVGWSADDILRSANTLREAGRVILLDYVDDRLLPGLYAGALAVVYPSWYEGFGLPVLEGLASGTPVIASRVPAHVEVAGDQAIFVDPGEPAEIAEAMSEVLDGRYQGAELRLARRARARRYSWRDSARTLAELMRTMATS
jgi:glycosyltransferase involved in cell wall biosynthesis